MSFWIDYDTLIISYKLIWAKIEDFQIIVLNAFPLYNDRYTKPKMRTFGNNIYSEFRNLNVLEDCVENESFTISSSAFLLL